MIFENRKLADICGEEIVLFAPRECPQIKDPRINSRDIVFLTDGPELMPLIDDYFFGSSVEQIPSVFISVSGSKRLNSYTPWSAPSLDPRFPGFGGNADQLLLGLEGLIPSARRVTGSTGRICLMGFSLGGLFSAYAALKSRSFDRIAILSGSFWFPGWADFLNKTAPLRTDIEIVMRFGSSEGSRKKWPQSGQYDMNLMTAEYFRSVFSAIDVAEDSLDHHNGKKLRVCGALEAMYPRSHPRPLRPASGSKREA